MQFIHFMYYYDKVLETFQRNLNILFKEREDNFDICLSVSLEAAN